MERTARRDIRVRDLMAGEFIAERTPGITCWLVLRITRWWRHLIYGTYGEGTLDQHFDLETELRRLRGR